MKSDRKIFGILFLTLVLSLQIQLDTKAAEVTYEGSTQEFTFEPGSEYSATDLFANFKDVMPGDELSQTVTIKNQSRGGRTVVFYMKSLGPSDVKDNDVAFLDELKLRVDVAGGDRTLFQAAASETDGLSDWVEIGRLRRGGEIELALTLQVPIELGNEYQETAGYIDWMFKIEELVDAPDLEDSAEMSEPSGGGNFLTGNGISTGDFSEPLFYLGLLGLSVTGFVLLKNKREKC